MSNVVIGIIKKQSDSYLLVSSKKDFGKFSGFYYPPSGHVEKGEDEVAALIREVNEELGLKNYQFYKNHRNAWGHSQPKDTLVPV